ncbi:MAG: squalene synthase HpnC [Chloroflexi bacterium]|nr:squalene synthase HpnC [Chloroflexota bacterium]
MSSLIAGAPGQWSVEQAYEHCRNLARTHYENFTVGSRFLPREKRPHLYAIYAFCRFVDDLGDEAEGDRLSLLERWEEELLRCYGSIPVHPIMVALQQTIRTFDIPMEPFLKLIEANRIDQRQPTHPSYADLLHYCQHSANPVGHLFLYLFGYRDEERQRLSDATCTALQLVNFWLDVRRDLELGRIYIPLEDMERFGVSQAQLKAASADDSFRELMRFEVDRARELFKEGAELVDRVDGIARLDITLFTKGGLYILDAIEGQGYDVLRRRPTLSKWAKTRLLLGTAAGLKLKGRA